MTVKSEVAGVRAEPASGAGHARSGLFYGIGAYSMWGVFPLYFHLVSEVPSFLVLCHRIFWSVLFLGLVVSVRKEWKPILPILRQPREMAFLFAGAVLIALNWLLFIYSIASRQVLQASLGYFINPLLSVLLGLLFMQERLRAGQWLAVLIAACALVNLALHGSAFPWLALSLAGTFGFYGLVRKMVDINSLHGLLIETVILFPLAVVILLTPWARAVPAGTVGVLSLSGVLTAVPLLMFGAALRRLRLSTVGFLQYIGPTLQFLVAVLLLHEPLDRSKLGSFALCWVAIAIYTVDSLVTRHPQAVADEPE